jgi:hypothetical protein
VSAYGPYDAYREEPVYSAGPAYGEQPAYGAGPAYGEAAYGEDPDTEGHEPRHRRGTRLAVIVGVGVAALLIVGATAFGGAVLLGNGSDTGDAARTSVAGDATGEPAPAPDPVAGSGAAAPRSPEPSLEPEPSIAKIPAGVLDEAGAIAASQGKTIAEVVASPSGKEWTLWALRNLDTEDERVPALKLYLEHRAPELWAEIVAEMDGEVNDA